MKMNTPKFVVIGSSVTIGIVVSIALLVTALVNYQSTVEEETGFSTFASCEELADRFNRDSKGYAYPVSDDTFLRGDVDFSAPQEEATNSSDSAEGSTGGDGGFSKTNNQVQGVDEADIVKTDGNYIYVASGKKVLVFDAKSPEDLDPINEIEFLGNIQGMFVDEGRLAIFGNSSRYYAFETGISGSSTPAGISISEEYYDIAPSRPQLVVQVLDTSDITNIKIERTISLDGYYNSARLIDGNLYLVSTYYSGYYYESINAENVIEFMPHIADVPGKSFGEDDFVPMADCDQVGSYDEYGTEISTVLAIDLDAPEARTTKVMVGGSGEIYMSSNNLYLTNLTYPRVEIPKPEPCPFLFGLPGCGLDTELPPVTNTVSTSDYKTQIFRISIEGLNVEFAAKGEVEGNLLNQFSMDEHSGYFRIATTRESGERLRTTVNDLHVLDLEDMEEVGSVRDLAKGERIFSVRFMGDKAYMVTFRQVDPLFVIDLSQPSSPKVVGELKIPGFSDYLHPYDQDHILGFGKDADTNGRVQGVKVALFDVSDPTNPIQLHEVKLGGVGSESEILRDHKALFFDREKDLLVIPIIETDSNYRPTFVGFKIFGVNVKEGFTEKAGIEVVSDKNRYNGLWNARSLFVDSTLYLVTQSNIQSVKLEGLEKISEYEFNDSLGFDQIDLIEPFF